MDFPFDLKELPAFAVIGSVGPLFLGVGSRGWGVVVGWKGLEPGGAVEGVSQSTKCEVEMGERGYLFACPAASGSELQACILHPQDLLRVLGSCFRLSTSPSHARRPKAQGSQPVSC